MERTDISLEARKNCSLCYKNRRRNVGAFGHVTFRPVVAQHDIERCVPHGQPVGLGNIVRFGPRYNDSERTIFIGQQVLRITRHFVLIYLIGNQFYRFGCVRGQRPETLRLRLLVSREREGIAMCTPIQRLAIGVKETVKIGSGACAIRLTEIIARTG